ncbi:MAG: T9SS type A sorting domain-containing protein [Bacteroidota bacterium]
MINSYKLCFALLLLLFVTLKSSAQVHPQYSPIPADFNINKPGSVHAVNIPYDTIDKSRQIFHLFLPDTLGEYPLVVFYHGGGFTGGNPGVIFNKPVHLEDVKFFIEHDIAFASIGYRVINKTGSDTEGVIKPLQDSKYGLQFLRYHAQDLHIKADQIALMGSSAGSGTSLWLSSRDEMADPAADDPVLRQSTRVCAVMAGGSQATYDLYKWESVIYQDFDGQGNSFTMDSIANLLTYERVSNFYGGLDSLNQMIYDPAIIQYRQDVDMLYHMSSDDPPIYIFSRSGAVHPREDLFHHSLHGQEIYDAATAAGIQGVKAYIPARSFDTTNGESGNEFLLRHLQACSLSTELEEQDVSTQSPLNIFPNPSHGQFSIRWPESEIERLELFDLQGRRLMLQLHDLSSTAHLSVPFLSKGLYVLKVRNKSGKSLSRKVCVK